MHIKNKITILFSLVLVLVLSSCNHDRNTPGAQYMDDMVTAISYEDYSPNPIFANGQTGQLPVEGTISRGHMPYSFSKTPEGQTLAGEQLVNPFKDKKDVLEKGEKQYNIYCLICHGDAGKGNGTLYESGKFTALPSDLSDDRIKNMPDGEIYHIITKGSISGLMGAHGPQIKPENRWKIITFIRDRF
ncbi:MAG: cytochrome c [Bacteroidetes bacterium]|nr:MAG: cytochrome c [Bacteroidota bacterium]